MRPTEILKSEHRIIEQVLDCLDQIAENGLAQKKLPVAAARNALDFLRVFADQCHHAKEESGLFPRLEAKGFSPSMGPTAVMRTEHEQGRSHICAMASAIVAAGQGDAEALRQFASHAQQYTRLLREHIHKEDHCLFPMAEQSLTDKDQEALASDFANLEHAAGEHRHEYYLRLADELAQEWNITRIPVACAHCAGI